MNKSNVEPITFSIRRLTTDDQSFLWEMLYQALYVPSGQPPFPREIVYQPEIAKYVLDWGKQDDIGFVVVDNSTTKTVGAVWIRLFSADNKGYGYVSDDIPELSIAILPDYRNQGIGTALLKHLIKDISTKYSGLSLSITSSNPAVRLYRRIGFVIFEENAASLTMIKQPLLF
ncbi:MAG TPA: GNAT family N-acetyltransferase [Blastocatellia bacterium]|nr:GNAT family N-acetyltransferase [Blastocatellia bacterium]